MIEDAAHSSTLDCECISGDSPIRQGDVLIRYINGIANTDCLCVVIDADCDLAQNKTRGNISALQILPLPAYIKQIWPEKKIEKILSTQLEQCGDAIHKVRKSINPNSIKISSARLTNWILETEINDVVSAIVDHDSPHHKSIHTIVKTTKKILQTNSNQSHAPFDRLVLMNVELQGGDTEKANKNLLKSARNELSRLPEDVFFIAEIPGLKDVGYVTLLRLMILNPADKVTTDFSSAKHDQSDCFCRIARLKAAHKYCLAQRFSWMYARVGLPDDHATALEFALEGATS